MNLLDVFSISNARTLKDAVNIKKLLIICSSTIESFRTIETKTTLAVSIVFTMIVISSFAFALKTSYLYAMQDQLSSSKKTKISSQNTTNKPASFNQFDISKPASGEDWNFFKKSELNWKQQLWDYHLFLKKDLSFWHWTWRIAWVQTCNQIDLINDHRCKTIIDQAQIDKALVVRSEVVTVLRELFQGSESDQVVTRLTKIYNDQRNYRNGKPLFIIHNIYNTLQQLGGEQSALLSAQLSKAHPSVINHPYSVKK